MKTFGEMTDEEQGALLLAHHRGEVIEWYCGWPGKYYWDECCDGDMLWLGTQRYRVKKEPVVEVRHRPMAFYDMIVDTVIDAQCTYTDGKLTKIHWEADQ